MLFEQRERREGLMSGKRLRRYLFALVLGAFAITAVPAAGFGQADRLQNLENGRSSTRRSP